MERIHDRANDLWQRDREADAARPIHKIARSARRLVFYLTIRRALC